MYLNGQRERERLTAERVVYARMRKIVEGAGGGYSFVLDCLFQDVFEDQKQRPNLYIMVLHLFLNNLEA